MSNQSFDIVVLGAGIVGISTAIHLRRHGLSVALMDRGAPGDETSYGNAGIIQSEAVHPYLFPRKLSVLVPYLLNRRIEAHYSWRDLPHTLPFLWRYFRSSTRVAEKRTMNANIPLVRTCLEAHGELAQAAGSESLISKNGWVMVFRSEAEARETEVSNAELRDLGMSARSIGLDELGDLEPHISTDALVGAAYYADPWSVSDPGKLAKSYAALFEREGGIILHGDASSLRKSDGWQMSSSQGTIHSDQVVVALGPWSHDFLLRFGLDLPMGIKRGYHMHYQPDGEARPSRPIVDVENGVVLSSMTKGIRMTTGAEFARRDAPPTPVQVEKALVAARELFPLGAPVDNRPWMGSRPVFPDMLPVIGQAPGIPGMWVNFGHGHHGLTHGPTTGKLMAQIVAGTPFCDPEPYSATRFVRSRS